MIGLEEKIVTLIFPSSDLWFLRETLLGGMWIPEHPWPMRDSCGCHGVPPGSFLTFFLQLCASSLTLFPHAELSLLTQALLWCTHFYIAEMLTPREEGSSHTLVSGAITATDKFLELKSDFPL